MEQVSQYTFKIPDLSAQEFEETQMVIKTLRSQFEGTLEFHPFEEFATCRIVVTVQEPSDMYIYLHNLYRHSIITGFTVQAQEDV